MELLIIIPLVAVAYVLVTVALQRKISNVERMRELQKSMKDKMKEVNDMIKSNADKATIDAKSKELNAIASENMKHTMKSSLVVLPIMLVVFYYLLPLAFGSSSFTVDILSFKLNYRTYFIAMALVIGLLSSAVLSFYDKRRMKQKEAAKTVVSS
ncbi:MAG: DUF106 domain-containing protein [Candidatus Micrarchaeota archaeon]|nr:DUF106 domain-containing protein [Candidatus Micrarchaeota archaeon]